MKDKIAFIWQGVSNPKVLSHWQDGLYAAMQLLEKEYEINYHKPWDEIPEDAVILYWEAPCTINGMNAQHYRKVMGRPNKKILLFAGGPLKKEWVKGFDMLCVESKINAKECEEQGIKHLTAFGINENLFYPEQFEKKWLGVHHGTCASWKRQQLLGKALGHDALIFGRRQDSDRAPFEESEQAGATVMDEQSYDETRHLLNQCVVMVQTADYWGGGQRATLEAMACGLPVICMSDSPKNREYVEESGFGTVVEPNEESIRQVAEYMTGYTKDWFRQGPEYVLSKWTSVHYADNLKKAICSLSQ